MSGPRRRNRPKFDPAVSRPRHPAGRTRRRWPRAYDGGTPTDEGGVRRYRRAYDGDMRAERLRRRRGAFNSLRQSPVRNGLIGLAVAGTAVPIAINKHQQGLRTDPAHESFVARALSSIEANEDSVTRAWQEMEEAVLTAEEVREVAIEESLERYSAYGLSRTLAEQIYDSAAENEIDPEIAFGLVRAESSFRNQATSPVGAVGLTQLMPRTAQWLKPGITRAQLRDPITNLSIGFGYLRSLIDKYEGNENLALVAYNRGPGTVDRELRRGGDPDNGYSDFVRGVKDHGHTLFTRR